MFRYIPARLGRDLTPGQVTELFERGEVFTAPSRHTRRGNEPFTFWPNGKMDLIFTDRSGGKFLCSLGLVPGTQILPSDLERFARIHGEVRVVSSVHLRQPFRGSDGCFRLLNGKKIPPQESSL